MSLPAELREAVADDIEALAVLHDREIDAGMLKALKDAGFPDSLGLKPVTQRLTEARDLMRAALAELPDDTLDDLAADYAAIYLNGTYGASPCESVWTDEDRLVCQAPMFALREVYAADGLKAADWRKRPDDHLVLELQYLARRLRKAGGDEDERQVAAFLDDHLLRWLPDFARRVAQRCETPFYAGLALLSLAYLDALRDFLTPCLPRSERVPEPPAAILGDPVLCGADPGAFAACHRAEDGVSPHRGGGGGQR